MTSKFPKYGTWFECTRCGFTSPSYYSREDARRAAHNHEAACPRPKAEAR